MVHSDWSGFDIAVQFALRRMLRWSVEGLIGVCDGRPIEAKVANAAHTSDRIAARARITAANERNETAEAKDIGSTVRSFNPEASARSLGP